MDTKIQKSKTTYLVYPRLRPTRQEEVEDRVQSMLGWPATAEDLDIYDINDDDEVDRKLWNRFNEDEDAD